MENPPVNPVTSANRTYAMVRDELRKHYEMIRASATVKPIFLSDFIFFRVHGRDVQLGRVVHAPFGGALQPSDTIDVTEYEHTAQQGTVGFFGTFKPLRNNRYDKNARGSLQFIRHRDVPRKDVLVFHVQTVGKGESGVQVCLSSLRELQQVSPDHPLPARLPASHHQPRHPEHYNNRIRIPRPPEQSSLMSTRPANRPPLAKPGDRIQVYWTEDPVGWFGGVVTSSRIEDGVWVTRVQYNTCEQWRRSHHAWHRLDPLVEDHVTWRFARDN